MFAGRHVPQWHDRGDVDDDNWIINTLNDDGEWHELDFSAIVPAGTKAVRMYVWFMDTAADEYIFFKTYGNTHNYNACMAKSQAIAVAFPADLVLWLDADLKGQYKIQGAVAPSGAITVRSYYK